MLVLLVLVILLLVVTFLKALSMPEFMWVLLLLLPRMLARTSVERFGESWRASDARSGGGSLMRLSPSSSS